jgi:methylglutaconyl-CoA hydratase
MKNYQKIKFSTEKDIARITLNRPEVRNAFNQTMLKELHDALDEINNSNTIKALILKGEGPVFSAGADLNWMKEMVNYSYEDNYKDSQNLYEVFEKLYNLSCPTITMVHGASIGGANGLIGASDIVLAEKETQFRFSEVKIGLVPATIAPFIIKRIGEHASKYYLLTGKSFGVDDALRIGLIDSVGSLESIETELQIILSELNRNNLSAVRKTKELINSISRFTNKDEIKEQTIDIISNVRISAEGQEGMKAFLEKRKPDWLKD